MEFGYYNMDCMEGMRKFPDKYFDLAIVDPPTGQKEHGGKDRRHKSKHVKKAWDKSKIGNEYFTELFRVSKNQIIWQAIFYQEYLHSSRGWIIWDKKKYNSDFADAELAWTSFDRAAKIYHQSKTGGDIRKFVDIIHPCQKPVKLYQWILHHYALPGWKLIDTHVGSASSLIAFEMEGFTEFVAFENDIDYYNDSKTRMEQWRRNRHPELFRMSMN